MAISLNYIDRSDDQGNIDVVFIRRNLATSNLGPWIAWKVIKNCGRNNNHPFTLSQKYTVRVKDAFGNYTPTLPATPGQRFRVSASFSGYQLTADGRASSPDQVQVRNQLQTEVSAEILEGGILLAQKLDVPGDGSAKFQFNNTLFVGSGEGLTQGQTLSSIDMQTITTEFALDGVLSSDVVMTGQNPKHTFDLENVSFR